MCRELLSFRLQHLCQVDLLGVGPQPLQIIELPGFVGEHMDHHVGKVHQQPGAAPVTFNVVGLPDAAVREARERGRAAVKNCGAKFPVSRITVNLAPAGQKKAGQRKAGKRKTGK